MPTANGDEKSPFGLAYRLNTFDPNEFKTYPKIPNSPARKRTAASREAETQGRGEHLRSVCRFGLEYRSTVG